MLSRITVHGFRCFTEFRTEGLTLVNLFVGRNNAGKTSLLEALELVALGAPAALLRGPVRRGEELAVAAATEERYGQAETDLSHLFRGHSLEPGADFVVEASGADGAPRRFVKCTVMEVAADEAVLQERLPLVEGIAVKNLAVDFVSDQFPQGQRIRLSPYGGVPGDVRRRPPLLPSESAAPAHFLRTELPGTIGLARMWDQVVLTPEEEKLVEVLRVIEPSIDRIAFLSEGTRRPGIFLKITGSDKRLPLGSLGDGIKRLLALSLHAVVARDGFLFVDEIDTGLHYSVMVDMWRLLIETASRLNVQVFATTHSLDCVRALAWVREKLPSSEDRLSLHRVERELHRTVRYTMREIATAAQGQIEMR